MRITWLNPAPIVVADGERTSVRPCVRLRSLIPGDELRRRGYDVRQVATSELKDALGSPGFFSCDRVVVGKAFADLSPLLPQFRKTGGKVVVDICDNVFAPPEDGLKDFYSRMLPHADAVTTSSETLKQCLVTNIPSGVPIFVVDDSVEGPRELPRLDPSAGRVRLLWFGFPNNLSTLIDEISRWRNLAKRTAIDLTVVSKWSDARRRAFPRGNEGVSVRLVEWSPAAMKTELAACDLVVVPSDDASARTTKSANRVISGLWAGKYVVAYPLPSYRPFEPYAGIGRDLSSSIEWALANRDEAVDRISRGQRFIFERFGTAAIGDRWEAVLGGLASADGACRNSR